MAFFPSPLPRTVLLSPQTTKRLDLATAALYRLGGLGRLLPNPTLLFAPHVRLEAVLSSKIEGTQSSISDLLLFEVESKAERLGDDDAEEVSNYVTALEYGLQRLGEGFPMSLRLIREVHAHLMQGVRGNKNAPGVFRSRTNWIGRPGSSVEDASFVPPPHTALNEALSDLERFLHDESLPLLIQLAMAHYQFEAVHPFEDGNGRVGRLLIPLILCLRRALDEPLLYLSAYFEKNRAEYYDLLLRTSQEGSFEPWFDFFLTGVEQQAKDSERRTLRLIDAQRDLRNDLLAAKSPTVVVRLAELLFNRPYVSSARLHETLGVSFPTAQRAISHLVTKGILEEYSGRRRNRVYFSQKVFDAVYGDIAP